MHYKSLCKERAVNEQIDLLAVTNSILKRTCVLLWRLFLHPVVGELGHVAFDAFQTVAEVPVVQLPDLHVDPFQKVRHQPLVVRLHLVQVHQSSDHLKNDPMPALSLNYSYNITKKLFKLQQPGVFVVTKFADDMTAR